MTLITPRRRKVVRRRTSPGIVELELTVDGVLVEFEGGHRREAVDWLVTSSFLKGVTQTAVKLPSNSPRRKRGEALSDAIRAEISASGVALTDPGVSGSVRSAVWLFEEQAYTTEDLALVADDIRALVNERANRRRLQLAKAHALQAMTEQLNQPRRRAPISRDVKIAVWQRDGGRCVECGGDRELEFDHVIPLAMGGSNTMRNLQLLCGPCNRRKGATLG